MEAVNYDRLQVVKLLLAKDADPNLKTARGWTPLMEASRRGNIPIIETLVKKGANPNATAINGERALNFAANEDIKVILKQFGAEKGRRYY